jgi:hypothetical protein
MNCFLLCLIVAGMAFAGQSSANAPDVNDIVKRSVAANEANWKAAPGFSWVERDVETKKSGPKIVKTYRVLMIEGSEYHELIAGNDQPLSGQDKAREELKLRHEIDRRQHESTRERARRVAKYQKERQQDHVMMLEMANAFNFQLVGEDTVDGHPVWVLKATPKPGYEPRNREARVLPGMQGKLYVGKEHYEWVRVEAEVVKPVSFFGFIAKVGPGTKFMLEQQPVAPGVWMPKRFTTHVNATALGFLNENSTSEESYRDYRPMTEIAELREAHPRI